jgi:hypothetical protein
MNRTLWRVGIALGIIVWLAVSPALAAGALTFQGKIVFQERSGGRIFIVGADGRGLRLLTHGLDPALSPNGAQVAFARWEAPAGIYVIGADGSGERLLAPVEKAKGPRWSADGATIAFAHEGSGGWAFYWDSVKEQVIKQKDPFWKIATVDVATGRIHDVHSDNHSFAPTWSNDGWWLAYDGEQGLMLTDSTGTDTKRWQQLTYNTRDMSPAWRPSPSCGSTNRTGRSTPSCPAGRGCAASRPAPSSRPRRTASRRPGPPMDSGSPS